VKLERDDVDRICRLAVDHDLDTQYVADRYDIGRRRVQQLAKEYRETDELPTIETPGRKLELQELHEQGAEAIAHILRQQDGITIDSNRVHAIL
jgi:transposase